MSSQLLPYLGTIQFAAVESCPPIARTPEQVLIILSVMSFMP